MSSTYTQILYHIVFGTKNRERTLDGSRREELFKYVWGVTKNLNCVLYRINGMEDHLHLLLSLHPVVPLAELVKTVKVASSDWIKREQVFPAFGHWQDGYGALTHSLEDKNRIVEYIKRQQEHHRVKSFLEEYREMLSKAGLSLDQRYLP